MEDSAGGMPTGATGKLEQQTAGPLNGLVALPRKSLMIGGKTGFFHLRVEVVAADYFFNN
jgi:hypothetical protein